MWVYECDLNIDMQPFECDLNADIFHDLCEHVFCAFICVFVLFIHQLF